MPASTRRIQASGVYGPVLFVVVLMVISAAYLIAPDSWGGIAFFATAVAGLLSFAVGPVVHRPHNRLPWRFLTAAGALFLIGLLLRLGLVNVGDPIGDPDLWAFGGYACTAPFLLAMLRRTHSGLDPTLWLDTAAITTGSALIGWVMNVAPELSKHSAHLGPTLVNAIYPVMDAMLLTLTVQLGFRRGSHLPALQAAVAGMAALLVGDLAYTFVWAAHPGEVNPYVNVCYLIAYASLGLMAMHPSMRELSDVDVRHTPGTSRARLVLILVAMLTPATIPIMIPTHGILDGVVRTVIMTCFGGLVYLRLLGTIRALQAAQAESHYRATRDGLTNLPNRFALLENLDSHLTEVRSGDGAGSVNIFFVNCDHFKQINESWGHAAGDEILLQLAGRLRSIIRPADYLSRVGGDEFMLRVDTQDPSQAMPIADRIMTAFTEPFSISSHRSTLMTPSIGIAQAPYASHVRAEDMIRDADLALYEAKSSGRSTYAIYDASMHEHVVRRHTLAEALRGALGREEIHVVYQPIRAGADYGELTGWEVLARWDHPELGSISPFEFVPIAEDTGVILDIGAFIMRRAAAQLKAWQIRFDRPDLHVSVNVSSVQLLRDDVPSLVSTVLEQTALTPDSLWLEITESVVLERTEEALSTLNALTSLGVKLCMDDFGTGYSSLSYLKDFTVHILKVDRAFVRNLVEDVRDRKLTKAMIDVAAALGLDGVVAEGVETLEQAQVLAELGCSHAQGYFYGRPASAPQAEAAAAAVLGIGAGTAGPDDGGMPRLPQQRTQSAGALRAAPNS
jgi:diguanylate cyclase (GGDEF)-like protein